VLALIEYVRVRWQTTTAFTAAQELQFRLFRLTGYTAAHTGGTAATLTTPNLKKRVSDPASAVGDIRIGHDRRAHRRHAHARRRIAGDVRGLFATRRRAEQSEFDDRWDCSSERGQIILAQNEGLHRPERDPDGRRRRWAPCRRRRLGGGLPMTRLSGRSAIPNIMAAIGAAIWAIQDGEVLRDPGVPRAARAGSRVHGRRAARAIGRRPRGRGRVQTAARVSGRRAVVPIMGAIMHRTETDMRISGGTTVTGIAEGPSMKRWRIPTSARSCSTSTRRADPSTASPSSRPKIFKARGKGEGDHRDRQRARAQRGVLDRDQRPIAS
jgi:hypothetical protein